MAKKDVLQNNQQIKEQPATVEVKLKGGNCSVDGAEYLADDNGIVTVTEAHAQLLVRDFGFERI